MRESKCLLLLAILGCCLALPLGAEPDPENPLAPLLKKLLSDCNSGDPEKFISCFAEDAVIESPLGTFKTRAEHMMWAKMHTQGNFYVRVFAGSEIFGENSDDKTHSVNMKCEVRLDHYRELGVPSMEVYVNLTVKDGKISSFTVDMPGTTLAKINKAMFNTFNEQVINQRKLDMAGMFIAEKAQDHMPGSEPGLEGFKNFMKMFVAAFPDMRCTVDDMVAENDMLMARCTMTGTHKGDFMGMKATGRRVCFEGYDIVRLQGPKWVEHWGTMDMPGLMEQLSNPNAAPNPAWENHCAPCNESPDRAREIASIVFADVITANNMRLADHFVAPDVIDHSSKAGEPQGIESFKEFVGMLHDIFDGFTAEPEILFAEGDKVAVIVKCEGTLNKEFHGMKPTGKKSVIRVFEILRVSTGKVVERWGVADASEMAPK